MSLWAKEALEFTFGSFWLCWLDKKLYNFVILALSARNKKKSESDHNKN